MNEPIWIELLSRHGDVTARHRMNGDEVRIGRGYDNDLVLDDPYVAPRHIRVFRDAAGNLVAEDLDTATGMRLDGANTRHNRLLVDGNHLIRIGRTTLRIRTASHPVAPERAETHGLPLLAIGAAVVTLAAISGIQGLMTWLVQVAEPKLSQYLWPMTTTAAFLAVWIGAWAILNRILVGRAQFERHMFIALLAMLGISIYSMFAQVAGFSLGWGAMHTYIYVAQWTILALVVFLHLRTVSPTRLALKAAVLTAILTLALGFEALESSEKTSDFSHEARVRLLPPWMRLVPVSDQAKLFADIERLKTKVDRDRTRLLENDTPH